MYRRGFKRKGIENKKPLNTQRFNFGILIVQLSLDNP